jgi:ankyrin repeat protein
LDTIFWNRRRRQIVALLFVISCSTAAWAQPTGELDEFFRSVTDGRIEIVAAGLRQHPEWANAELFLGIRPVYRASVLGREEVLALLLEAGADVNATTDRGTHPLHAAAQHGYPKIMDRLLAAGATVDAANDAGQTPLFLAVRYGHEDLAERLVAKGASLQTVDWVGRTPLHYAAGLGHLASVRFLVDNGSPLDLVDSQGFSPLGLCQTWKRNEFELVSQYLTGRGARDLRPESAWVKVESPPAGEEKSK